MVITGHTYFPNLQLKAANLFKYPPIVTNRH